MSRRRRGRAGGGFESNGPDVRVRGSAEQIRARYEALAQEADAVRNPVLAESYRHHAEHWFRRMGTAQP